MSREGADPRELELGTNLNPEQIDNQGFSEFQDLIAQPQRLEARLANDRPYPKSTRDHAPKQRLRFLRVMKFGGTSVGDASCIAKVVEIIQTATRDSDCVVVVSAMSGVTNLLLAAAVHAANGDYESAEVIFDGLRQQHELAIQTLFSSPDNRATLFQKVDQILEYGKKLCNTAASMGELSPACRDSLAGSGERLSAHLLAAALDQRGVRSEAVEATQLIVTDSCHGGAEPLMDLTVELCQKKLRPLVKRGIVPVVTGYIGATLDGVLTTLGRGGSDYSATTIGAALQADEIVIWTDVDGILTADPRLVKSARTIPQISYKEASELAYFGAKVLHPKSLRPLMQSEIPVWIRNTFSPEKLGTKINASGPAQNGHVKAITAMREATLITVRGQCTSKLTNALRRALSTAKSIQDEMLLIAQPASQQGIGFIVNSQMAERAERALRNEFAEQLSSKEGQCISADSTVGVLTLVGNPAESMSTVAYRTLNALEREKVGVVALAHGLSASTLSFVIRTADVTSALLATHREFQLGATDSSGSIAILAAGPS